MGRTALSRPGLSRPGLSRPGPSRAWLCAARLAPVIALGGGLLLAGCAADMANPYPPVPPLRSEILPKPPVTATPLVWQPGHWNWNGSGYEWESGQYVPSAGHSNEWMPGHWALVSGGWTWQPAHWL